MGFLSQLSFRFQALRRRLTVLRLGDGAGRAVTLLGDDARAGFWSRAYLGAEAVTRRRRPRWQALERAARHEARRFGAAVLTNLTIASRDLEQALKVPEFVDLEIPLEPDIEAYRSRLDATLRNETRRCEHLFEARFSERDEDLVRFQDDFHAPTAVHRYGVEGVTLNIDKLRQRTRGGVLLKIFHDGEWIAGVTVLRREHSYKIDALGVLGGDRTAHPRLLITALYWFSLRHTMENGKLRQALGGTTPLLESGVHRFKDKWQVTANARTTYAAPQYLFLDPDHPACRDFLARQTIYFWDGSDDRLGLLGNIADRAELEERILRYSVVKSLSGVYSINQGYPVDQRLEPDPGLPAGLRSRLVRVY